MHLRQQALHLPPLRRLRERHLHLPDQQHGGKSMSDLTKWPRLLVTGENVTREQANEILIRTDGLNPCINDRVWERTVKDLAEEFGRPRPYDYSRTSDNPESWREHYAADQAWRARMGLLDLHYLRNARIASSWIGGPHGWCDWEGRIGCSNYNIGKWPSVEEVTEDWTAIAEAFPYLALHAQLVTDEGEGTVAATWAVRDGKAALVEPAGQLAPVPSDDVAGMVFGLLYSADRERGVSINRLREALAQVAAQQSGEAATR
ncbi:hypothetical protein [Nonomuraea sp. NPDC048901]|uniref:hypothetical protein n=1 Tax=Nonomuraea sp. NPDC048901 TaxID=3155627 RepID=UPI0033D9FD73